MSLKTTAAPLALFSAACAAAPAFDQGASSPTSQPFNPGTGRSVYAGVRHRL